MPIRWIFFDVGYTLINEDDVWQRRFEEQAQTTEAIVLGLTPEIIRQEVVQNTVERNPQYRSFIQKYGLQATAPYRHSLEKLYPETITVLKELSQRYSLGIIANQSAGLEQRLAEWKLLPFLSLVVSSWDYQLMKPDPRLFEAALQKAGCPSAQAVMVGDRLDNDIQPAKLLGMHTVWLQQGFGALQTPLSPSDTPNHIITNLVQLLQLF